MATRSEEVIAALHAALVAKALASPALPSATRNEALADLLEALPVDGSAGAKLNLVDGDTTTLEVQLGTPPTYELSQACEVEWLVQAVEREDRDAAFDAGLIAIAEAVEAVDAAIEAEDPAAAGMSDIRIASIQRSNLVIDGAAQLKGATIIVTILFTSPRPF